VIDSSHVSSTQTRPAVPIPVENEDYWLNYL
jgi:hypothetical protein